MAADLQKLDMGETREVFWNAPEIFREHFYNYLDAGVKYGWMTGSILGWYEGGGAIRLMLEQPDKGRPMYDALYHFVKGTYEPTGRGNLPELTVLRRHSRNETALAAIGAKIRRCIRPEGKPAP